MDRSIALAIVIVLLFELVADRTVYFFSGYSVVAETWRRLAPEVNLPTGD